MVLKNHIGYRFLKDDELAVEMVQATYPTEFKEMLEAENKDEIEISTKVQTFYNFMVPRNQKAYYITKTVLDKLDLLKIKKINTDGVGKHYDWTFFKNLKNQKLTFIFPDNSLLRMEITKDIIMFCQVNHSGEKLDNDKNNLYWVMFYVDRITGKQCDHFSHDDVKKIEKFVYSLMAFFFLSENEMVIVEPGKKYGTRKTGKLINTFPNTPVTIVDSKWNITSIRTEGFGVSGHFALRWTGKGRAFPKMIFIEPYQKKGYMRKAKKLDNIN